MPPDRAMLLRPSEEDDLDRFLRLRGPAASSLRLQGRCKGRSQENGESEHERGNAHSEVRADRIGTIHRDS
jgi:hypothetical protein